jgi:alpha-N-acetylglucosamine transferase
MISGGLAKKHLDVPVSLVTDESTEAWMKTIRHISAGRKIIDKIILVEKPKKIIKGRLHDGVNNTTVPFVNLNRASAWDLTPYDRTLLLDSDYLIFSDRLNEYWDLDEDILISQSINDIYDQRD